MNENKNMTFQNLRNATKAVLGGKFTVVNTYPKKKNV